MSSPSFHGFEAGLTVTAAGSPAGPGRALVSLAGDIDTAATPLLSEAVEWLTAGEPASVLIDLAAVTYAGSALLNFVAHLSQAMPAETELIVWRPSPRASLVLRSPGITAMITVRDTFESSPAKSWPA